MKALSIVIPAYNEENYLPETLRHVQKSLAAIDSSTEVVVVDNESTDATARIANDAGAIVVVEPVHNISRVRNTGAANSDGEVIVSSTPTRTFPKSFSSRSSR